jgi:hypothetical protein
MYKKILFAVLLSVAMGLSASAQKLTGDISPLKGQEIVNVVLDFSGTLVNGKEEAKFIADETAKKNATDKEKWLKEWNEDLRRDAYNTLILHLNAIVGEALFSASDYTDAEYTINIKVKEITTGLFSPFSRVARDSGIKAEVTFVKTGETTPFATVEYKNASNSASSITPPLVPRVLLSFGTLGEDIGATVYKALK